MPTASVFWPAALGTSYFIAGIVSYWRELLSPSSHGIRRLTALGPTFVAASLGAFAGEHFTAARSLAGLVPRWMPAPLFIAYFVGVAHLAAATSFVARRCIRWAALGLAVMFALFVLLMDLPAAVAHPAARLGWILAAREATFAMGALALFATAGRDRSPGLSKGLASIAVVWAALVVVYYGLEHLLYPMYSPGVPSSRVTASWVPLPSTVAYLTGFLLILLGVAMLVRRYAGYGGALAALLMALLTLVLYVPDFFLARDVSQQVTALNFIFDTLLFSGTLLVITRAIPRPEPAPLAMSVAAA